MVLNQAPQALLEHVGVDLGRRNVGVAEQLLDGAQVGAALEQVAGEGVTQHMGREPFGVEAGAGRQRLQLLGEALARQMTLLGARGKQPWRGRRSGARESWLIATSGTSSSRASALSEREISETSCTRDSVLRCPRMSWR